MTKAIPEEILKRYLENRCSPAERQAVDEWYASFDNENALFADEGTSSAIRLKQEILEALRTAISQELMAHYPSAEPQMIPVNKRRYLYAALKIAAVLLIAIGGSYLASVNLKRSGPPQAHESESRPAGDQINVGARQSAVLTLPDGRKIALDSITGHDIPGTAKLINLQQGLLAYNKAGQDKAASSEAYHSLATPRSAQYHLILSDGTHVWLNAASSIRYPAAFSGSERLVEITGEAYFEVAKSKIPFRVKVNAMEVNVLGTHFNVNAYDDESTVNTTLLEGSVRLTNGKEQVLIRPGEQAALKPSGTFKVNDVDVSETVAWKNGMFQFDNAAIDEVMRQIARWYDVEIVYENTPPSDRFHGKIHRDADIHQLFRILRLSGVRFRTEGKKIIVQ